MTDWDHIRETHGPMVWATLVRILVNHSDAADCFQDVFVEALQQTGDPIRNWGAYLRWLATRRGIDALRRQKRVPEAVESIDNFAARSDSVSQDVEFAEMVEIVRTELAGLPAAQSEAFWLVCVERRSYQEVSEALEVSSNAVGVLVHRARKAMQSRLSAFNPKNTNSL